VHLHTSITYKFVTPPYCREQASPELVCSAHGPVDSSAQAGYMNEILLVVAMLLSVTDNVKGAGVSDLFRLHENDIARERSFSRGQNRSLF